MVRIRLDSTIDTTTLHQELRILITPNFIVSKFGAARESGSLLLYRYTEDNMKPLLEVLLNIIPINEASGFVFTIDYDNPLSDICDKVENMSKNDYIDTVLKMAGKKGNNKDFQELVNRAVDTWFEMGHELLDIPFAFNQNGHIKLRMAVASKLNYSHKESVIPGVVVGDGTISLGPKITTDEQESATVICWNRMVKAARSKNDGFDINNPDDVRDIVASIGISLPKDWVKSCQIQCVAIFEFLKQQGIKKVENFQATRYGKGDIGKLYADFVQKYANTAEQSKWDNGYDGRISKDNYDPSDIILYKGNVATAGGVLSNLESYVQAKGWEAARDLYKKHFLKGDIMGISLKKVHDPCKVEYFNINKGGAVVHINSIDGVRFSKGKKTGTESGCQVFVNGKFKFDGITDPENSEEFETISETKLVIELRSFGDVGMDVKQVHNNKPGIALGKVPVRFWRRDLGTQSNDVAECAKLFGEWAQDNTNTSKLENLIKEGIKAGPWCLPFVLIH